MGRNASIPVACCFFAAGLQSQPNTAGSKKRDGFLLTLGAAYVPAIFSAVTADVCFAERQSVFAVFPAFGTEMLVLFQCLLFPVFVTAAAIALTADCREPAWAAWPADLFSWPVRGLPAPDAHPCC